MMKVIKLFIIVFLATRFAFAQPTTSLEIQIRDPNGDVIIGASIILKDKAGAFIKEIKQTSKPLTILDNLALGTYTLTITKENFKPHTQEIEIQDGKNLKVISLEIADVLAEVEMKRDRREQQLANPLGGFLTKQEIEALPEDPEQIEKALKARYGENVKITVDGVVGKVPPKSMIANIRVMASSYDAQNHELGAVYVNIQTKFWAQSISGKFLVNFENEALNARLPLALERLPRTMSLVDFSFIVPLKKNKAMSFFNFASFRETSKENIVAVVPSSFTAASSVKRTRSRQNLYFPLGIFFKNNHILRGVYAFDQNEQINLGVGGFNLPDRAYSVDSIEHNVRVSEGGYIGSRFFNELNFTYDFSGNTTTPVSRLPTVIVNDAFTSGGANQESESTTHKFSVSDNLLFNIGKQALKIGALIELEKITQASKTNHHGTFIFSSLEDFERARPALFTQSLGTRKVEFLNTQFGAFIQNDYTLNPSLVLSMGFRYEKQNRLNDSNNFSPRFSFTWSPLKSGNATFRGGVGIFYNWLETNTTAFILSQDESQPTETIIIRPNFFDPLSMKRKPSREASIGQSFRQFAPNIKNPYVIHSSFGGSFYLPKDISLQTEYVFQKGLHQFRSRNINAPRDGIRPVPSMGNIINLETSAFFERHSLKLSVDGRFLKRFSYYLSYTLGKKTSDYENALSLPTDNYHLSLDRAPTNSDQRHKIYANFTWQITPGSALNLRHFTRSPLPFTITTGFDNNRDTTFNDRPLGVKRNSERGNWTSNTDVGFSWHRFFGERKKARQGMAAAENMMRDRAPSSRRLDRNKKFSLRFFIYARNVFNQTNFAAFSGVQTSPFFRQPIATAPPRQIQMGLSFGF